MAQSDVIPGLFSGSSSTPGVDSGLLELPFTSFDMTTSMINAAAETTKQIEAEKLKKQEEDAREALNSPENLAINQSNSPVLLRSLGTPPQVPTFLPDQPVDYRVYNFEVIKWKSAIYKKLIALPEYKLGIVYKKGNIIRQGDIVWYLVLGQETLGQGDYPGVPGSDNWSEIANIKDYAPPPPPPPPAPPAQGFIETPSKPEVRIMIDEINVSSNILPAIGDPSFNMFPVSFGDDLKLNPDFMKAWKFPEFYIPGISTDDKVFELRFLAFATIGALFLRSRLLNNA